MHFVGNISAAQSRSPSKIKPEMTAVMRMS